MSFGTIVNQSQVTLKIFISGKLLQNQTGNLRRSRPGRGSIATSNRLQSITGQSEVGCKCITAVVVILVPEFMPIDLRMACEGHDLASLVVVQSQVTLITWPMSVAPLHQCKR